MVWGLARVYSVCRVLCSQCRAQTTFNIMDHRSGALVWFADLTRSRSRPPGSVGKPQCRTSKKRSNHPVMASEPRRMKCTHKTTGKRPLAFLLFQRAHKPDK